MKIISSFLISIFIILLLHSNASANNDTSCYIEFSQFTLDDLGQNSILIETTNQDLYATQNGVSLPLISHEKFHRYIPFSSNIEQAKLTDDNSFKNRYTFGDLDTSQNKIIELSFQKLLEAQSYEVLFSHDARYHRADFYVSTDGESFSQVLPGDIGDFSIKKIKIIFEKTGNEDIREIIHIKNLSISKNLYSTEIQNINPFLPLQVYRNNSCTHTQEKLAQANQEKQGFTKYRPEFTKNPIYVEKTTDTDRDGIKDLYDNCKNVRNSDQTDKNQNGVGDACEFDSDSDGVPDEIDNCRNTTNPLQEDTDKDSIGNLCDNCRYYNPNQIDTDGNSIGDVCDQKKEFLLKNDKDQDGIVDFNDNCSSIANADQADDDNDGIGNSCDNCRNIQNTQQLDFNLNGVGDICEDSDNDGISGLTDNCINIANSDQADDDNDGIGNLCEDDDRDNVIFSLDNCPYTSNRNQLDTDNDGIGDRCDDNDDRLLESNKELFILLMFIVFALFGGGIYAMFRKLQK